MFNAIPYVVDAINSLKLVQDVLAVIDMSACSGSSNTIVPPVVVLDVFDLAPGGIANFLLGCMSSSRVNRFTGSESAK